LGGGQEGLERGRGGDELDAEVREAKSKSIRGVPQDTGQDKYELDGAQNFLASMEAFVKITSEQQAQDEKLKSLC
jgi:hypothetical protein